MTRRRDLKNAVEELSEETNDDGAKTKAELGITADFVHFEGEPLPDLSDGWTWDTEERFITAVREEDTE